MLSKLLQLSIPPWVKFAIPAALALFAGIQTLRLAWTRTALEKLTAKIAVMAAVTAETDKRWRATENTWKVTAYQIQKERDDEIKDIAHERDAALAELRNRPRRPAPGTAEASGNGYAGTGLGLARDDAEFLTRYAAAAAELQARHNACVRTYKMIEDSSENNGL